MDLGFSAIFRENWARVGERVERACARSGRRPDEVEIMAVSKTQPLEKVLAAYEAGVRLFGENRVQEGREKRAALPADARVDLIGHLQSNKAKEAAGTFSMVHSLDKVKTALALDKAVAAAGLRLAVLIEVNTSGEDTKDGVRGRDELLRLVERLALLPSLEPRGLMTMAPFTPNEGPVRRSFAELRACRDLLREAYPSQSWDLLSMGMSGDFEWAIEEGSTLVRIGTILFGGRAVP